MLAKKTTSSDNIDTQGRVITTEKNGEVEDQGRTRRILRNFGFLTAGKTLGDAFTFLLLIVLSRAFGQEGLGYYSFAMGLTGFFAVFADFGLYSFAVKELARRKDSRGAYLGKILSLSFVLSAGAFVALLSVVPILPFPTESKFIIVVVGGYQIISRLVEGLTAAFVAREDTHLSGLIEMVFKALAAVGATTVILAGGSLVMALTALPVAAVGQTLVSYVLVTRRYGRPKLTTSVSSLVSVAREARPYAFSCFLSQLHSRFDIVLLGFLLGAATTGVYNAAYRIVFLLMFISLFLAMAIFPSASRLHDNPYELKKFYHQVLNSLILIALPMAGGLYLIAPAVISVTFGERFEESAWVLRMLTGLLLLSFPRRTMGVFMMSCEMQSQRTMGYGMAACTSVIGNLALIPTIGIMGAAVSALASELVLTSFFAIQLGKILGWPRIGSRLAISSMGVAAFCVPFVLLPPVPLMTLIPASALLYLTTLLLFKDTRTQIRMVLSLSK